ncbi:sugar-phosphatase [Clostridium guangxiense]|uniref:sugar-phosphatase n=1 Tax=Clostridium guangxiense TaxID=1662055 RepID=UPI001E459147|nr:sugar-phosphatase [Clostridium guangxiense]MCD2346606.1 sugar-phosphatase [Clostridium guangxiense]
MYKLIALDMDGTLLKDDKTISKANFDAIKTAKENGYKVVLATGRPAKGIEKYLKQLDLMGDDDYAVAFNGAVVQKTKTGHIIAENLMKYEDLQEIYDLSLKLNLNVHTLTTNECITPKINPYSEREAYMNNLSLIEKPFDAIDRNESIIKIMLVDSKENLDRAEKLVPQKFHNKYTVVRSEDIFLEFLNKKVDKGFGVSLLAKNLGLSPDEIICVGDAGNDIAMVKYAGLGVAMGNAFPEVKKICDYVTKSNEEDGVAHVIHKFMLSQAS